jgi:hypothetical protein
MNIPRYRELKRMDRNPKKKDNSRSDHLIYDLVEEDITEQVSIRGNGVPLIRKNEVMF